MWRAEDVLRSIEMEAPAKGLPIIGPIRGVFLDDVIREHHPTKILEVGTLVGYSAIRMARLLESGGHITCVELSPNFARVAVSNIEKAGLADRVDVLVGDAKSVLPRVEGSYDMVFLDAVKDEYVRYLKSCERLLHPGSVVVADNVKSHAEEVADYLDYVRSSGRFRSTYREAESNHRYGASISEPDAVEISVML
jgi:predicted O-methyltransferase YrrM